jgi:hypothetical protein
MVQTLTSPGVSIAIENTTSSFVSSPSSRPLVVFATRANKALPDASGTALGTQESNVLRTVTSQREARQMWGDPVFVTSAGEPVHGHETNEYGLHALWTHLRGSTVAYGLRADIDLAGLVSQEAEPNTYPPDGTYWIERDTVIGGMYRRTAADDAWEAQGFIVFLTTPSGGTAGNWAFDYTDNYGTLKVKADNNTWFAIGSIDFTSDAIGGRLSTNNTLWVGPNAPTGSGANDFWWKIGSSSNSATTHVYKFRASDSTWLEQSVTRSATAPTNQNGALWEDISTVASNGRRQLKIGNGSTWSALTYTISNDAPVTDPTTGDFWIDTSELDFELYREVSNGWRQIVTTSVATPTQYQKVISATAPTTPGTNAIWVDVSDESIDDFPVIKRWNGTSWENISDSVRMDGEYIVASSVADGSYWLNIADPATKNTVKVWDPTYEPVMMQDSNSVAVIPVAFDESTHRRWKPVAGARFGRKAIRHMVVTALQAAVAANEEIRSESIRYDLIVAPGYPELYDDLVSLNSDIDETAFVISDVPFRMIPSGVAVGSEITVTDWKENASDAATTGELGFTSSGYGQAAWWYPHGLSTNTDGLDVMVPSSTIALRTLAYSDANSYPWFAPMGEERGLVLNAGSVGYLDYTGEFKNMALTKGQRNVLYENYVNPIAFFNDIGLRIWGQKTALGTANQMDRINVARLIAKMKYELKRVLRGFIGEPNDQLTWSSAENVTNKYLAGLRGLRALTDYAVRCNSDTNTAARIARKEMWVDVAILPTTAVEFIYVPIRLVDSSDQL